MKDYAEVPPIGSCPEKCLLHTTITTPPLIRTTAQQCTEDEAASQDGTNADYGDSADGENRRSSDESDRDQSQQV